MNDPKGGRKTATEHFQKCEAGCSEDSLRCLEYVRLSKAEARKAAFIEAIFIVSLQDNAPDTKIGTRQQWVKSQILMKLQAIAYKPEGT